MKKNAGILFGIGVGPGDPELLTLKAQRLINDSDVLAYPAPETGDSVAVICEGDPFFYGSFMYIFERLSERYSTEIIPGVSSPMACAAALKTPLVFRNEILTILPAPLEELELEKRLLNTDAAAIIKVGRHLPKIRRVLRHLRLEKYSLYIEHATMKTQKIIQLDKIDSQKVPYFSMILVRKIRGSDGNGAR